MVATVHESPPPKMDGASRQCRVAFFTHKDLEAPDLDLRDLDFVFTDSLRHVPFGGRLGPLHFLENLSSFEPPEDLDAVMRGKTDLLSVLLPPHPTDWGEAAQILFAQAQTLLPDHTYIDDGTAAMHEAAFRTYRFSLIAEDLENRTISLPFVRSLSYHTIPLFNGFTNLGYMVTQAIADFDPVNINLIATIATVRENNEKAGVLWSYHRILQDQLQYRFNRPFEERFLSQACSLCRLRSEASHTPALAFVGIYSAKANFAKRNAVRETWGQVLHQTYGLQYKFFLGEISLEPHEEDERVRREIQEHDDIVVLSVDEGYRMNSRKGLLFLEWIALHSGAEFLLKTDDDVYFRPAPLLEQLRTRPPIAYAWGFFDYISPVPREEGNPFCNSEAAFPFEVFPPYPRGVVRVLSMDIVRHLSEASRKGSLRMIFGDDPCLGVHLRQLIFDPHEPLPSLALDDRDSYRVFAMEPSCHPKLWSKMTDKTWAVHHVSPEQVRCMWDVDMRDGYYKLDEQGTGLQVDSLSQLDNFPNLCACAPDPSFEGRNDVDTIRDESLAILYEEGDATYPGK